MNPKPVAIQAATILKSQSLLWLGEIYTALRIIIIAVLLALLGVSSWASAEQGKFVSPVEVLVSPEIVLAPVFETVIMQTFPDAKICNPEGVCFTLVFVEQE